MNKKISILGISGSLRNNSSATSVLKQVARLFSKEISFHIFEGLAELPHFNDSNEAPRQVVQFRELITESDGVFICTPEYAFGVPGSLKNAIDWTVGSGDFVNKPVALITASSVGDKGHAALLLILSAITASVDEGSTLLIPFIRAKLNEKGEVKDEIVLNEIRNLVEHFEHRIITQKSEPTQLHAEYFLSNHRLDKYRKNRTCRRNGHFVLANDSIRWTPHSHR